MSAASQPTEIARLRERIEELDFELVNCLAERFRVVEELAHWKARLQLPVSDPGREEFLMRFYERIARGHGFEPKFIKQLFERIIRHSCERQERQKRSRPA